MNCELLMSANSGVVDLTNNLVAHYLLNNNADDIAGTYDGTVVGTVDFQGDQVDTLSGSITIPSTGGVWCSYWEDTGTGMTHVTTSTVPTSLATNNYSNLRIYNEAKNQTFINALYAEGYYPKPLPLPATNGLIAHYPLTGTAEDTTGNYNGTENGGLLYADDVEKGAVPSFDGVDDSITLPISALISDYSTYSISIWFYYTVGANILTVSQTNTNDKLLQILMSGATNKIQVLYTGGSAGFKSEVDSSTLATNSWYHLVITNNGSWDASGRKIYINAVNDTTIAFNDSDPATPFGTGAAWMASHNGLIIGGSNSYNVVKTSALRLYSRVLSQTEITDIYNYEKNFRYVDIDDSLIAYYPLADNSLDNYKNQNDGNDNIVTYDGLSGTFNGSSSYVNNNYDFTMGVSGKFTVALWFNSNDGITRQTLVVDGGTTNGVEILINNNNLYGGYAANGVAYGHIGVTINTGVWNHVLYTFGSNGTSLYLNGNLISSIGTTQSALEGIEYSLIGALYNGSPYYLDTPVANGYSSFFNGKLSKTRYYTKNITAEQAKVIYNLEKGDFGL